MRSIAQVTEGGSGVELSNSCAQLCYALHKSDTSCGVSVMIAERTSIPSKYLHQLSPSSRAVTSIRFLTGINCGMVMSRFTRVTTIVCFMC